MPGNSEVIELEAKRYQTCWLSTNTLGW